MIPWLQAQANSLVVGYVDVVITPPERPPVGLLMTRKEALDAAQALIQAVANESGLPIKIQATPVPEILRCSNKLA